MKRVIPFREVRTANALESYSSLKVYPLLLEALNSLSDIKLIVPLEEGIGQAALENDRVSLVSSDKGVSLKKGNIYILAIGENSAFLLPQSAVTNYLNSRLGLKSEKQKNALPHKYVVDSKFQINEFVPFESTEDIDDDSAKGVTAWRQADKVYIEGSTDEQKASFSLVINKEGKVEVSESYGEVESLWGSLPEAGKILSSEEFKDLVERLNQD